MSKKGRTIRCYHYVNHPYEQVSAALTDNALTIFQSATKGAAARARSVATELRVSIGTIEIGTDVTISIDSIDTTTRQGSLAPVTCLELQWEAAKRPHLFPCMKAEFSIYPLTGSETQLDFSGEYVPPLGTLGSLLDTFIGHKVAEASVHEFVADVAAYLRSALG